MTPQPQTSLEDPERTDALSVAAAEANGVDSHAETVAADAALSESTITIELNFNAFADNVPPTHHARRIARAHDPSVQDFADQALELAALRAELKRLSRDYGALQQTMQLRERRLHTLQTELAATRAHARGAGLQPTNTQSQPSAKQDGTDGVTQTEPDREHSSTMVLTSAPDSVPAPALQSPNDQKDSQPCPLEPKRQLVPVDHEGEAITLSREIITIGRTNKSDICIPSRAVSRDHARLLVGSGSVTVFDMDSANGCFVNDEPVRRHKLRDGDVLRIGDRSYRFAMDAPPNAPASS